VVGLWAGGAVREGENASSFLAGGSPRASTVRNWVRPAGLAILGRGAAPVDSMWRTRREELDATPTPTPTPLVTPTPVPVVSEPPFPTERSIEEIILSYDWDRASALRVFQCENGYNGYGYWRPAVISETGDYGITQINAVTWDWWLNLIGFNFMKDWMIPERNIAMAYAIYEESGGFWPWNCY